MYQWFRALVVIVVVVVFLVPMNFIDLRRTCLHQGEMTTKIVAYDSSSTFASIWVTVLFNDLHLVNLSFRWPVFSNRT